MAASQEIAVRSSSDIAALDELHRLLLDPEAEVAEVSSDPDEAAREIIAQIMAAESDDETYSVGSATGWRDLEGVPVEIRGFRWRASTFEEGGNVYVIVSAVLLDDGEMVTLTTGGRTVLAQLYSLAKRGKLPGEQVRLVKAKKATANGFYPLQLERVGHRDEATATEA